MVFWRQTELHVNSKISITIRACISHPAKWYSWSPMSFILHLVELHFINHLSHKCWSLSMFPLINLTRLASFISISLDKMRVLLANPWQSSETSAALRLSPARHHWLLLPSLHFPVVYSMNGAKYVFVFVPTNTEKLVFVFGHAYLTPILVYKPCW